MIPNLMLVALIAYFQQLQMRPERPNEFWPVTITGWVTLVSSTIAVTVVLWRANNRPVLERLEAISAKFQGEISRIEKRLEERLEEIEAHSEDRERSAMAHQIAREEGTIRRVDDRLNGFSARVEDSRLDITRLEQSTGDIALRLVRSEEDRKQLNFRITELGIKTDNLTASIPQLEIRMNAALTNQTNTILREFGNIVNTTTKAKG